MALGPGMLDLVELLRTDMKTFGLVFIFENLANIIGSGIGTPMLQRFNVELILVWNGVICALCTGLSLFTFNVYAFIVIYGFGQGITNGVIFTGRVSSFGYCDMIEKGGSSLNYSITDSIYGLPLFQEMF